MPHSRVLGGKTGPACRPRFVAAIALGALVGATDVWAGGVVGNGTPASCTEAALNAALAGGGSVTFNCGPSPVTIPITQQKVIAAATTVDGGSADRIILDAGGATRIFLGSTGISLTVRNLTLQNGRCPFPNDGGEVPGYAGAIRAGFFSTLTVSDSRFLNNACVAAGNDVGGGAIFVPTGTLVVQRSTFDGNRGGNGGAIGVNHTAVTIEDSVFTNNTTNAFVGGFSGVGGAFYVDEAGGGQIVVRRSTFTSNSGAFMAGAVHIFLQNTDQGAVIEDSTFQGNSTVENGGALFHQNKPLTISGCTFDGNSTIGLGAGMYVVDSAPLTVVNSTFSGNTAIGIDPNPGSKGIGGAAFLYQFAGAMNGALNHVTIANNHADWVGGGIATSGAVGVSLRGSIVANNTAAAPGGIGRNCATQLQDGGFNLQFPAASGGPFDPNCTAGITITDPLLGPLAANGGLTQTRALLGASPARNAVASGCPPPPVDQRGVARPQLGTCDIGAYEAAASLSIGDVTMTEGTGGSANAVFTVTLSQASGQTVTVGHSTANGTAVAGADYTAVSGTVTFTPGSTSQPVSVPVLGDASDENDETFVVNLTNPVNAAIADGQGLGTITDDDPPPSVSISDCTAAEGNAGATACAFTVSLSTPSGRTVTVGYATANGSALAGSDYTATSGTLTFPPGTPSILLPVAVDGDTADETDETFVVNLSGPTNASLGDAQGAGTIDDDDGPGVVIDDVSVTEGNAGTTNATFTVSLTVSSPQTVTVSYATSDGTATAGSDYSAASGMLTFGAGSTSQPLTVSVNGDVADEPDERFYLNLSGAADATILDPAGIGTIRDDDGGTVQIRELSHGSSTSDDLAGGADLFVVGLPPPSSWEVVVDESSGDVGPGDGPGLERLGNDLATMLQGSSPVGVGPARSLRWQNAGASMAEAYVRVRSRQCAGDCGADDVYRVRAYETTYTIPRFNNSGSQVTVLILQNPTLGSVSGTVFFWSSGGALLASQPFTLASHATLVLNTAAVGDLAGQSGAVTLAHDGRYGELAGKAVALEPATGFSFDSPMAARPR